ncbi:FtsJ methyltransferase [Phytophthora megakarya]|uniref:Cap-specific mRNA (nucleoside-2'-O-)-methyltransferase 1 n=1 Tax=Phytophthora megakarya TaxID=4795 RepID=A0A225W6H0_9STRA|nr:FtsJ methyltransferase [Phytophthora megakarya]
MEERHLLDVALENATDDSEQLKVENSMSYSALLEELELEKHKFEQLNNSQFLSARTETNVFETLGRHRFLNRSAMKLVTLDHIFQWTQGLDRRQSFSFADICGGPGGFSEYLLWRTQEHDQVHGFGITLKEAANNCDWRLPSKLSDLFEICYGEDGTGNLYSVANIHHFRDVVRKRYPNGVDLVVADGGLLDARSQSNQTSRPASSERYIIARGLRVGHPTSKLVDILENTLDQSTNDAFQLTFLKNCSPMHEDGDFLQYMAKVNGVIATSQIQACQRINQYATNKNKRKTCEGDTDIDPEQYFQCWKLGRIPHQ